MICKALRTEHQELREDRFALKEVVERLQGLNKEYQVCMCVCVCVCVCMCVCVCLHMYCNLVLATSIVFFSILYLFVTQPLNQPRHVYVCIV